jgi:hypothetical protein
MNEQQQQPMPQENTAPNRGRPLLSPEIPLTKI